MEGVLTKGALYRIENGAVVHYFFFQYNPTTVVESLGTDWYKSSAPGQYMAGVSFKRFVPTQVSFQLFLFGRGDGLRTQDQIKQLRSFCMPGSEFSAETPSFVGPGRTKLILGPEVWNGVTDSLRISREVFNPQLEPTVARVDVAFTQASKGLQEDVAYHASARKSRLPRGL